MTFRNTFSRKPFTLIELLVVISIIAILAALLLPALFRAKYVAKEAICVSNMKQVIVGLQTYATDFDRCYPRRGVIRNSIYGIQNHSWTDISFIFKDNYLSYDYMKCPLAPEKGDVSYGMYFATRGHNTTSLIGGLGPWVYQYDAKGRRCDWTHPYKSDQTKGEYNINGETVYLRSEIRAWGVSQLKGIMMRMGQPWRMATGAHQGKWFDLFAMDKVISYGGHPMYNRQTNHPSFNYNWLDYRFDRPWEKQDHWSSPRGGKIYPQMEGHFAGQDGHIQKYVVPMSTHTNGGGEHISRNYTGMGNSTVPLDFEVER